MAATATQQVIANGPRNLILKYTIAGTSGDTSLGTLVDLSALDSTLGDDALRLDKAEWSFTGFSCKLQWDAAPEADLVELASGDGSMDFSDIGGITNNGAEQSGDVLFTTSNYTASGDGGHMVLSFKKRAASAFSAGVLGNFSEQPAVGSLSFDSDAVFLPGRPQLLLGSLGLASSAPSVSIS